MAGESATTPEPSRTRSPRYPGIDLGRAVERARALYNADGRNAIPVDAVWDHWGFSGKTGPSGVVLAALKYFGLIEDEGRGQERRIHLSDEGLLLVLDNEAREEDAIEAIQRAALAPKIHKELWAQFDGDIPSDLNLRVTLEREKGFTPKGAQEFIRQFRRTLDYAGLIEPDRVPDRNGDSAQAQGDGSMATEAPVRQRPTAASQTQTSGIQRIPIRLPGGDWVFVEAAFPLTETEWNYFFNILAAQKAGLVEDAEAPADDMDDGDA